MICSHCRSENPAGQKFCGDCGAPLPSRCRKCGAENPPNKKFCGECGAPLGESAVAAPTNAGGARIGVTSSVSAHDAPDGERKNVTALFADIKGSMELIEGLDPEEARALVDPALRLMIA